MRNKLNLKDSREKKELKRQEPRRRDSELIEKPESQLTKLRLRLNTRKELRLLNMLVFKLNKEWNRSVSRSKLELKQNKLREKLN